MSIFKRAQETYSRSGDKFRQYAFLSGALQIYRDVNAYIEELQKPYADAILDTVSGADKKLGSLYITDLFAMISYLAASVAIMYGAELLGRAAVATLPSIIAIPVCVGIGIIASIGMYIISEIYSIATSKEYFNQRANRFAADALGEEFELDNVANDTKPSTRFAWLQNLLPSFLRSDLNAFIKGLRPDEINTARKKMNGITLAGVNTAAHYGVPVSLPIVVGLGLVGESMHLKEHTKAFAAFKKSQTNMLNEANQKQVEQQAFNLPRQIQSMQVSIPELQKLYALMIGDKRSKFANICREVHAALDKAITDNSYVFARKAISDLQGRLGMLNIENIAQEQPFKRISACINDDGGLGMPLDKKIKEVAMTGEHVSLVRNMMSVFSNLIDYFSNQQQEATPEDNNTAIIKYQHGLQQEAKPEDNNTDIIKYQNGMLNIIKLEKFNSYNCQP